MNALQGSDPPAPPQFDEALAVNVSELAVRELLLMAVAGNLVAELAK